MKVDWDDATSTVILESPKAVEKKHVELKKDAFVAGNGYNIISDDGDKISENSPVTVVVLKAAYRFRTAATIRTARTGAALHSKTLISLMVFRLPLNTIRFRRLPLRRTAGSALIS